MFSVTSYHSFSGEAQHCRFRISPFRGDHLKLGTQFLPKRVQATVCCVLESVITARHLRPRDSPCALSCGCSKRDCGGSPVHLTRRSLSVLSRGCWRRVHFLGPTRADPPALRFLQNVVVWDAWVQARHVRPRDSNVVADLRPFETVGVYFR